MHLGLIFDLRCFFFCYKHMSAKKSFKMQFLQHHCGAVTLAINFIKVFLYLHYVKQFFPIDEFQVCSIFNTLTERK